MHILPQNKVREKQVVLSERLSLVAESLPKDAVVCDVGSDHGDLPLYLLQSKKMSRVIVTDLNEKPLSRAKEKIAGAGFSSCAEFVLTDGIESVLSYNPDYFVIAGMGGETISGILERGMPGLKTGTEFVLQPMTKVSQLRTFLYENGFCITSEKVVFENDKFFNILWAVYDGVSRPEKLQNAFLGEHILTEKSVNTKLYLEKMLHQLNSKISGRKKAGVDVTLEEKNKLQIEMLLKEFK